MLLACRHSWYIVEVVCSRSCRGPGLNCSVSSFSSQSAALNAPRLPRAGVRTKVSGGMPSVANRGFITVSTKALAVSSSVADLSFHIAAALVV